MISNDWNNFSVEVIPCVNATETAPYYGKPNNGYYGDDFSDDGEVSFCDTLGTKATARYHFCIHL